MTKDKHSIPEPSELQDIKGSFEPHNFSKKNV